MVLDGHNVSVSFLFVNFKVLVAHYKLRQHFHDMCLSPVKCFLIDALYHIQDTAIPVIKNF